LLVVLKTINSSTKRPLFDYTKPTDVLFHLPKDYRPRLVLSQTSIPISSQPSISRLSQPSTSCPPPLISATPMPDRSSSTPAWDPSSRTPTYIQTAVSPYPPAASSASSHASTSRIATTQDPPQHLLLDPRLLGVTLKVNVKADDDKSKERIVSIVEVGGQPRIRYTVYNSPTYLQHNNVSPKYPNPTRDNGLLIVIQGQHCGKYVRRIHHRYDNGQAIVILAVVERVDGKVDTLTGEQLELGVEFLCVCSETQGDKKLNSSLMTSLREEARNHYAANR
jgi:hypothetical protein